MLKRFHANLLDDQLVNFQNIRKIDLTIAFRPQSYLIQFRWDSIFQKNRNQLSLVITLWKVPGDKNKLAFYSIGQLAELIRTKQITSIELTKFFLDRLKKYDPELHCVITLTEQRALNQAKLMDQEIAQGKYRGMLHGIPFGAKDLLATKNYKTTWGATPLQRSDDR